MKKTNIFFTALALTGCALMFTCCKPVEPKEPQLIKVEFATIADITAVVTRINTEIKAGNKVEATAASSIVTQQSEYDVLKNLASAVKSSGGKAAVVWGYNSVWPAVDRQPLLFAEFDAMGRVPLGINTTNSAAPKRFYVKPEERDMFINAGVNPYIFSEDQNVLDVVIHNIQEIQSNTQIINLALANNNHVNITFADYILTAANQFAIHTDYRTLVTGGGNNITEIWATFGAAPTEKNILLPYSTRESWGQATPLKANPNGGDTIKWWINPAEMQKFIQFGDNAAAFTTVKVLDTTKIFIQDISVLAQKLPTMQTLLINPDNAVAANITGNLVKNTAADHTTLSSFGTLQTTYGTRMTANYTSGKLVPDHAGMTLSFADWTAYNRPPVGINPANNAKFNISPDEKQQFINAGLDINAVNVSQAVTITLFNNNDINNLPNNIQTNINNGNEDITVTLGANIALDNSGSVPALAQVMSLFEAQTVKFTSNNFKLGFAADSVRVENGSLLQKLYAMGALGANAINSQKYPFIGDAATISSVPTDVYYRYLEGSTSSINLAKGAPNKINMDLPLDGQSLADLSAAGYTKSMAIAPQFSSDPGGKTYVYHVSEALIAKSSSPAMPNSAGQFNFTENPIVGRYVTGTITSANYGHSVITARFGGNGNKTGEWFFISFALANDATLNIQRASSGNINLEIQTTNNNFINNNGNVIVSMDFIRQVRKIMGLQGSDKLVFSNMDIVLTTLGDASTYENFLDAGNIQGWYNNNHIQPTNCNIIENVPGVIEQLPAGKQVYQYTIPTAQ